MKRRIPVLMVILMLVSCISVSAMDSEHMVGEVLYHQNFSDVSDFAASGIAVGSASSENCMIACPNESLAVQTFDTSRVYILLPEAEKGDGDSYTLEFTFRFTDIHTENGYLAPILTCRGTEPTNISSLIIRADGSIDNFAEPDPALAEAISAGETIHVRIPVSAGVMHEAVFTVQDTEYTVERENVLMINNGSVGFIVRNANVAIDEVYVVYGTDYDEKVGYYADQSYADDSSAMTVPASGEESGELSPETGDSTGMLIAIAGIALVGGIVCGIFFRKNKR